MKIRNKKNGINTLAYKINGITKKEIIPSNSIVVLSDLQDFNQIVNRADFLRGWFEIVEDKKLELELKVKDTLDNAKEQAVRYTEEIKK